MKSEVFRQLCSLKKLFWKYSRNSEKVIQTEHILKAHNYAEYELCCWRFSRNFLKIFGTAILKENLLMDIPYFIKENLRMRASYEATLKNKFGRSKPSSKLTLKTKWYYSCGCCDNSWSCEQLEKRVTDKYFEKKVRLITFHYRKCMLPLQYFKWLVSTWHMHICLTEIAEEKRCKLSDYLNQI